MANSADHLATDADLQRRVNARLRREPARKRIKCKRCDEKIPEERRRDAIYCSMFCQRAYRWEQITNIRTDMRGEFRKLTAPTQCKCGALLNNRLGRHGRIRMGCKKCQDCAKSRAYYWRQRANAGA